MPAGERLQAPSALAAQGVSLRPIVAEDRLFLEHLYRSVRWDEFAPTGWSDETKTAFLASQFDFQRRHYEAAFPGADYLIIQHADAPIGRIYVDRGGRALWLVEISLLPEWRGKGIGAALLAMLQSEAASGGFEGVRLSVDPANPARRLYARMGFVEAPPESEFGEAQIEMVWPATAAATIR